MGRVSPRTAKAAKLWRQCCDDVDERDGKVCYVTKVPLEAFHDNPRQALHRHHLQKRSTYPERRFDPTNVISVSGFIHDLLERKKLRLLDQFGNDAIRVSEIAKWVGTVS